MGGFNQQSQDVEFMPGIRQDFSPVRAPRGALVDAQNVRFGRQGEIRGRRGTRAVGSASSTSYAIQNSTDRIGVVGRVGNCGILGLGGKLFARDAARDRLDFFGLYSTCKPVRKRLGLTEVVVGAVPSAAARYGVAVNSGGYVLTASIAQYAIEAPSGARVLAGARTASKVACLAVGAVFYLVYQAGTTITAHPITVSSGNITVGSDVTVGTLNASAQYWDITPAADGVHWYLAFQNGATTIRVDRFAGTTSNANQSITIAGNCPISLYADSTDVYLGWYENPTVSGNVRYRTLATNLGSFRSAVTTIASAVNVYGPPLFGPSGTAGVGQYVYRHSNGSTSPYTVSTRWGTGTSPNNSGVAGTVTGPRLSWHAVPISKPDSRQRVWVMFGCQAPNQLVQRAALMRMETVVNAGQRRDPTPELVFTQTALPHAANMPSAIVDMFHHVAEGSGSHVFALPHLLQRAQSTDTADLMSIEVVEYEPSSAAPHRQLMELGLSSVVAGQPVEAWGIGYPVRDSFGYEDSTLRGAAEVGFVYPPTVLTATQSAGGNLTASGNYRWLFIFEWVDAYGRRHRSAPSAVHEITALGGGNNTVTFQLTTLAWSQRHGEVANESAARVVPYRTVSGGTTFYRESPPMRAQVANDSTTGQAQWVSGDSTSHTDANISSNEEIYVQGGAKQNDCAPSCIFMCESEDRLWLGGLWDGTIIQASKIRVPGEPIQFTDHASFQVVLPDVCTGLAYLDGAVVAFAEKAIYAVTGEGPADNGVGSFSSPRAICRDIGCVDYASILETCVGVLFKGERGYYLLPRGLGRPVFIGGAIQRMTSQTGDAYTTVLGAAVYADSETHTARFLVSTGSADRVLVYDLDIAAEDPLMGWSYDTYSDRLAAIGVWPEGLALAKQDLSSLTHALYLDESTPTYATDASNTEDITTALEAADLRPAGLAGWWQCSMVGAAMSRSDGGTLTMTVTTDGDSTTPSVSTGSWSMTSSVTYQYRFVCPTVQQCTAATVRLSCVRTGAVFGPVFHGLTVVQSPAGGIRLAGDSER